MRARCEIGLLWLLAIVASLGAAGCSCGGDSGADAGGRPSPTCANPSTPGLARLVNGGIVGPSAAPANCQLPIGTSSLPAAQVQSLGTHLVGEKVGFAVPAGTGGISIISQASSGVVDSIVYTPTGGQPVPLPNGVLPTLLTTPAGTVLYDDSVLPPADESTIAVSYPGLFPSVGTMTLPNTTAALTTSAQGYPAGNWSVVVNDLAYECTADPRCDGGTTNARYDLTVLTRPVPYTTGTVDLSFYLVTSAMTATRAMTDAHVARFVSTLAVLFAQAGLCLGTVTFYDVPAWAVNRYSASIDANQDGPCDGLRQMFTLAVPSRSINFFLVDSLIQSLDNQPGQEIAGSDGTIPGPSSIGGTVSSGAALNFSDLAAGGGCEGAPNFGTDGGQGCGADVTAYITAHEGGHWLGLFHTSESSGTDHDPLSDTPTCVCAASCGIGQADLGCCLNASGSFAGSCPSGIPTQVTGQNCSQPSSPCGGARSMMFWLFDEKSKGEFSPQQAQVMRANPIVQ